MRRALEFKSQSSIMIYNHIKQNGILDRLRYIDHKEQLVVLSKINPIKYEQDIRSIWSTLEGFNLKPTRDLNHLMIQCCSEWNDVDLAMKIYNEFKSDLSQETINYLLKMSARNKLYQEGLALWKSLSNDPSYSPSFFTFSKVIELYGNIGDVENVIKMYSRAISLTRNSSHLTSLRNSYFAALVKSKAYDIIKKEYSQINVNTIPSSGLLPMHHILLRMCIELQDLELGKSYFQYLKSKTEPDEMCFSQMIVLYGQKKDIENARRLFQEANVNPTSKHYPSIMTSLLIMYCNLLLVKEAEALLQTIPLDKLLKITKNHIKEMYLKLNRPIDAEKYSTT